MSWKQTVNKQVLFKHISHCITCLLLTASCFFQLVRPNATRWNVFVSRKAPEDNQRQGRYSHHSSLYSHKSAYVSKFYTPACMFFFFGSNLQQFCLTSLLVHQMFCCTLKLCCIYIALLIYCLSPFYRKSRWICIVLCLLLHGPQ